MVQLPTDGCETCDQNDPHEPCLSCRTFAKDYLDELFGRAVKVFKVVNDPEQHILYESRIQGENWYYTIFPPKSDKCEQDHDQYMCCVTDHNGSEAACRSNGLTAGECDCYLSPYSWEVQADLAHMWKQGAK